MCLSVIKSFYNHKFPVFPQSWKTPLPPWYCVDVFLCVHIWGNLILSVKHYFICLPLGSLEVPKKKILIVILDIWVWVFGLFFRELWQGDSYVVLCWNVGQHVGGRRLNYHNLRHPQPHNPSLLTVQRVKQFLISRCFSFDTALCSTTTHVFFWDEVRIIFPKFHDISYLLSKQPFEHTAYDFDLFWCELSC